MPDEDKMENAKKDFGVTSICQRAGFILPSGELLDFGDPKQKDQPLRTRPPKDLMYAPKDFIRMGAISSNMRPNGFDLALPATPTEAQWRSMARCMCDLKPPLVIGSQLIEQGASWHFKQWNLVSEDCKATIMELRKLIEANK